MNGDPAVNEALLTLKGDFAAHSKVMEVEIRNLTIKQEDLEINIDNLGKKMDRIQEAGGCRENCRYEEAMEKEEENLKFAKTHHQSVLANKLAVAGLVLLLIVSIAELALASLSRFMAP